jgi:phospholipid/cholesterol/gamma-HCH transport system substrate-binding protein
MSTILNIRNLELPGVSRTALVVGTVVVLAIVGGLIGWNVYTRLTTNSVVAYFPETLALYPGDQGSDHGRQGRCDRTEGPGQ